MVPRDIEVIAKIERKQAVENLEKIVEEEDWVFYGTW
jgi:pyruvate kinase